ncbi:uncharacterized protein [Chelonus insularis]|uniref:uncharacterized protein n=1 Tax=Chelonus insularis TaxID=460826 RepID=UPI00158C6889|nr:uncharacterized protein LOC118069515 [Chelonus insularis]
MNRNVTRESKRKQSNNFNRFKLLTSGKKNYHDVFNKKIKLTNVPYMNTRSVTKKMYNIGATYHAPNINDEIQWREWPVHGMHERPIFHPQVGLATEFFGHKFVSIDGLIYKEISQSLLEMEKKVDHSYLVKKQNHREKSKRKMEDSFENCMHDSFHAVLAYSAQIVAPYYQKFFDNIKKKNSESDHTLTSRNSTNTTNSFMSSELNSPNYSQSLNVRNSHNQWKGQMKNPLNLKCIQNHAKLQQVLERRNPKNTLILLKTLDPNLKKDNNISTSINKLEQIKYPSLSSTSTSYEKKDYTVNKKLTHLSDMKFDSNKENHSLSEQKSIHDSNQEVENDKANKYYNPQLIGNENNENKNWLQELIQDTAILYCTAVGVHQDDLVEYLNNLDSNQCMNWLNS